MSQPKTSVLSDFELFKDVFESITLYLHITSVDVTNDPNNVGFTIRYCQLSISNVPFTDSNWSNKCCHHRIWINDNVPTEYIEEDTYEQAKSLMVCISKILTLQGHEVYTCDQLNPGPKIGSYNHFSNNQNQSIKELQEKAKNAQ